MTIKISHESPLCLLNKSLSYNDYDYALVHLFDVYPEYLEFYKTSLKNGRTVYLDNSVFELGESYSDDVFIKYLEEFNDINEDNFYYVVPDVINNSEATVQKFKEFRAKYSRGKTIGVVQGSTYDEVIDCFEFMKEHADIVGIGFNLSYFGDTLEDKYQGRIDLIKELEFLGYLDDVKIHLLGCSYPQEFKNYKDVSSIVSLDTSSPVLHGMFGIVYNEDGSLYTKNNTKMADVMDWVPQDNFLESIGYNLSLIHI